MANHRIVVKNTLFLYFRMALTMVVGLYASRVVLQQLGVTDFGIYSVVASLSMLFAFLNFGISSSFQRYLSVEISSGVTAAVQRCLSTCLLACVLLAAIVLFIINPLSLGILLTVIDIPAGRMPDAIFVLQFSMLIMAADLFKTCLQSLIIAHERMSFFAYISIVEAILKLCAVLLLAFFCGDKLRIYMWLLLCVALLVLTAYGVYCRLKFAGLRFSLRGGRRRLREIFSFTGWNTLASFADLCYMQGSNVLLNMFFGVALNATMGITNQVKNAFYSFSRNIQMAANPHMIKEYAQGDYASFARLTEAISKISFLLLLVLGLPLALNTDYVLELWLTTRPPMAVSFIRLMIVFCLVDSLVGPLWVAMQARGELRTYQIVMSTGWLLSLPATYAAFSLGAAPQWVIGIQIIFNAVLLAIRLWFAVRYCNIDLRDYLTSVVLPLAVTSIVGSIVPVAIALYTDGLIRLGVTIAATSVTVPATAWFVAMSANERNAVKEFIHRKFSHGTHR